MLLIVHVCLFNVLIKALAPLHHCRCESTVVVPAVNKPKGAQAEGGQQCMLDALFFINGIEAE